MQTPDLFFFRTNNIPLYHNVAVVKIVGEANKIFLKETVALNTSLKQKEKNVVKKTKASKENSQVSKN